MRNFLKLVHMEVHRFRYILLGIMGLTLIIQTWAVVSFVSAPSTGTSDSAVLGGETKYSFAQMMFGTQFQFALPVVLGIAGILLYIFMIWYRDWFGRNSFIYRLLTLPTARRSLYLSKLTAILIFVFGLLAFQVLVLAGERLLFNVIVPADQYLHSFFNDAVAANRALATILPRNLDRFILSYGVGIVAVIALFTAILLERSYRLIGLLYSTIYLMFCSFAVVYPMFVYGPDRLDSRLYPEELFLVELAICGVIAVGSLWLGFWLLRKKISV